MRRIRTVLTAILSLTLSVAPASLPAHAAPCWRPPVSGQITDHFRPPACPYCAGNRGIEYRTARNAPVRAVEAGIVTFSGRVASTAYVVIEHRNNWKVTYGRLTETLVERGQRVARGARVGVAGPDFYFGLRINDQYRDPETLLGTEIGRPRLVPVDGTARRAVPSSRWACEH